MGGSVEQLPRFNRNWPGTLKVRSQKMPEPATAQRNSFNIGQATQNVEMPSAKVARNVVLDMSVQQAATPNRDG